MKFLVRFEARKFVGFKGRIRQRTIEAKNKKEALILFNTIERHYMIENVRIISIERK